MRRYVCERRYVFYLPIEWQKIEIGKKSQIIRRRHSLLMGKQNERKTELVSLSSRFEMDEIEYK